MMRLILTIFVVISIFLTACNSAADQQTFKSLDLLEHGIPLTIMAPDSAEVTTMDMGIQKDITIKGNDNYYVQLYMSDATTTDLGQVKADQLALVKGNRYFSKIVEDFPAGFIYETAIDSTKSNYDFRYIRIQGDKEYIFQRGLIGDFGLEEVKGLYKAVEQ